MTKQSTLQVFGISNNLVASYVERGAVDSEFIRGIQLKKHIIVFGSSKQGKTSLIKKHLHEDEYIKIECSPDQQKIDIYKSILRQLDVEILEVVSDTSESELVGSASANLKLKFPLPFFETKGEVGAGGATKSKKEKSFKTVEYNVALAQDMTEILHRMDFNKYILLENFHYLEEEVQKQIAFDLRTYQDVEINFIILGIWRETNRLSQYNGDLQDRVIEIPVEPWLSSDLADVVEKGASSLNIDMSLVKQQIIESSFDSVGVLQELCKESCLSQNVTETAAIKTQISQSSLNTAITKKLDYYSSRHIRSLESIATASQTTTRSGDIALFIPFYFVSVMLKINFEDIVKGIKRERLHEEINKLHHRDDGVRSSDINYFLNTIIAYQIRRDIKPPLLDYDKSIKTLKVIDSTFYFFLRHADRASILSDIYDPANSDIQQDVLFT